MESTERITDIDGIDEETTAADIATVDNKLNLKADLEDEEE